MRLAEFAVLVDAPPKWVLNARALLREAGGYAMSAVERFALIRELNRDFGMELRQARAIADKSLALPGDATAESSGVVSLHIDIPRLQSAIAARASRLATLDMRRRAGRRPKRVPPLTAARRHGVDITLLQANLSRTHAERLRQLDGMMAFKSGVKRKG